MADRITTRRVLIQTEVSDGVDTITVSGMRDQADGTVHWWLSDPSGQTNNGNGHLTEWAAIETAKRVLREWRSVAVQA